MWQTLLANKLVRLLAIVLGVQLLLGALVNFSGGSMEAKDPNTPLLNFSVDKVDGMTILGADAQAVELVKKDGQWQVVQPNFPADSTKVDDIIKRMQGLQHGLPLATTSEALTRFKVADNAFERRVRLKQGDKVLADLFLGDSTGARQNFARSADDKVVYSIDLGSYDVPTKPEDWMNRAILKLEPKDVTSIKLADWTVKRQPKSDPALWDASSLPADKLLNQTVINDWLGKISNLGFDSLLDSTKQADYGLDKPVLAVTITDAKGEHGYQFGQIKGSEDYALKVSDRNELFKVLSYVAKPLMDATQDKWLIDAPKPAAAQTPIAPTLPVGSVNPTAIPTPTATGENAVPVTAPNAGVSAPATTEAAPVTPAQQANPTPTQ